MMIQAKVWNKLSSKEKFEMLLLSSNISVIGSQVLSAQKNKSYTDKRA